MKYIKSIFLGIALLSMTNITFSKFKFPGTGSKTSSQQNFKLIPPYNQSGYVLNYTDGADTATITNNKGNVVYSFINVNTKNSSSDSQANFASKTSSPKCSASGICSMAVMVTNLYGDSVPSKLSKATKALKKAKPL